MSAPFAGGSQPMPGQWPESTPHHTPYGHPDQSIAPGQDPRPQVLPPPNSYIGAGAVDAPQPPFAQQPYDSGSPRQFHAYNPTLDTQSSQQSLTAPSDRKAGDARRPSGNRICAKCGLSLSGQFVRALDATYHLECFTCRVSKRNRFMFNVV